MKIQPSLHDYCLLCAAFCCAWWERLNSLSDHSNWVNLIETIFLFPLSFISLFSHHFSSLTNLLNIRGKGKLATIHRSPIGHLNDFEEIRVFFSTTLNWTVPNACQCKGLCKQLLAWVKWHSMGARGGTSKEHLNDKPWLLILIWKARILRDITAF